VDEQVRDKERANFCGSFQSAKAFTGTSSPSADRVQQRRKFDNLFGDL
jgi:hypothetical protein